jgi:hypothetical protein
MATTPPKVWLQFTSQEGLLFQHLRYNRARVKPAHHLCRKLGMLKKPAILDAVREMQSLGGWDISCFPSLFQ